MTLEQQVASDCAEIADRYHCPQPSGNSHSLAYYAIRAKYGLDDAPAPTLPGANECTTKC